MAGGRATWLLSPFQLSFDFWIRPDRLIVVTDKYLFQLSFDFWLIHWYPLKLPRASVSTIFWFLDRIGPKSSISIAPPVSTIFWFLGRGRRYSGGRGVGSFNYLLISGRRPRWRLPASAGCKTRGVGSFNYLLISGWRAPGWRRGRASRAAVSTIFWFLASWLKMCTCACANVQFQLSFDFWNTVTLPGEVRKEIVSTIFWFLE